MSVNIPFSPAVTADERLMVVVLCAKDQSRLGVKLPMKKKVEDLRDLIQ